MRIYVGDLEPDLQVTIKDQDLSVDASGVPVTLVGTIDGDQIFSRSPDNRTYVPPSGNDLGYTVLDMNWREGDTDRAGRMKIVVVVEWPGQPDPQTIEPLRTVRIRER
jgi:hypothetical protein